MYEIGKEIDFYGIQRKKQLKKLIVLAIINFISAAYLVFILTL